MAVLRAFQKLRACTGPVMVAWACAGPHAANASTLREGEYAGTLQCGPRLTDTTFGAWSEPLRMHVKAGKILWRREDPNILEEGELHDRGDSFELNGQGEYKAKKNASSRWLIVGRVNGGPDAVRGTAMLLNADTRQPTRNCTLAASWQSPPLPASDWDAGRVPKTPSEDMTFFGYPMDGLSPRWRGPSDGSGSRLMAGTRFWEDKFLLPEDKTPQWLVAPMRITLQTTSDGRIREATFTLNPFQDNKEMTSPAVRSQKMTALIARMTEKFGSPPDSRLTAPWKLVVPWDTKTVLPTEVATWTRSWGRARLFSCGYDGYYEECSTAAFAPSIHIETQTRLSAQAASRLQEQKQKASTDASRVKL